MSHCFSVSIAVRTQNVQLEHKARVAWNVSVVLFTPHINMLHIHDRSNYMGQTETPRREEWSVSSSPSLVMDFGAGVSHTMTIYEGYALLHAIFCLIWLTVFFQMKFLTQHRYPVTTTAEREIGHDIKKKKKLCYMSFDYDTELKSTAESSDKIHTYELPDRNIISPNAGRFCRTSGLPASFIGTQASGLHDTSSQNNMKCYVNIRKELYANVVFPHGTTRWQLRHQTYVSLDVGCEGL